MGSRRKPDHYSERARREGYAARSVYKLKEIQEKFGLIRPGARVLDVGAAPGSWTQYALSVVGPGGSVVAVDLKSLRDISSSRLTRIEGDVFDQSIADRIKRSGPFDCILCDAAPKTTGNRTVDTSRSAALVEQVIGLAAKLLAPEGNFVAKVFQGGEERDLLRLVQTQFKTGRIFKPRSSRSESFEVFIVGTSYTSET